jgi:hypothetical protein
MSYQVEDDYDAFYVEYSTDFGQTWNLLGTTADPNWYNNNSTLGVCLGNQWSGSDSWKRTYSHSLNFLSGEPNVLLRFVMSSDEGLQSQGIILDDLQIKGTLLSHPNRIVDKVKIYPNPAKEKINLKWKKAGDINSISIYNMQGVQILNKNVNENYQINIDVSSLSKGIYIIKFNGNNINFTKKVIIK